MMYDELVKSLRICSKCDFGQNCWGCKQKSDDVFCCDKLLHEAADAIEGLQKCVDDLEADNDKLCERIKDLSKWIPVTERLPERCKYYLVTDFGSVEEAYYNSDGVWYSRHDDKLKDVTHWMPLPEPPESEE